MNWQSISGSCPLVAVVIPAHNAAATLDAALHSARGQTYTHLDIIVVDDGSTDETPSIAVAHKRADARVRLISQEQGGVASARNRGTAEASAEFVATLDADDLWQPEKIERQMSAMMDTGESCALVYTFSVAVREDGHAIDWGAAFGRAFNGYVLPDLLLHNFIANGSSPLLRKRVMREVGGYDPGLRAQGAEGCEDLKLYLAVAESHGLAAVPLPLTGYRVTSTSMSSNVMRMIRSHRLVTEPYRERYPREVRLGRVYLALYYAGREFAARNYLGWGQAVREAAKADLGATLRAAARKLFRRARRSAVEPRPFPAARAAEVGAMQGDQAS